MGWRNILKSTVADADDLERSAAIANRLEQVALSLENTNKQLALRVAELKEGLRNDER